jgi:hypothetical protein
VSRPIEEWRRGKAARLLALAERITAEDAERATRFNPARALLAFIQKIKVRAA